MRKTIYKSTAICSIVLFISIILILTIYPLRVLRYIKTVPAVIGIVEETSEINDAEKVSQSFIVQHKRIDSIDLYVTGFNAGVYINLVLYDESGKAVCSRLVDTTDLSYPTVVKVRLGLDVKQNTTYKMVLGGYFSSYRLEEVAPAEAISGYGSISCGQEERIGKVLRFNINYDIPRSKWVCIFAIAVISSMALLLCLAVKKFYKSNPEKDIPVIAGDLAKAALYFAMFATLAVIFVCNFPFRLYSDIKSEIIFYSIGLIIAAIIGFFLIKVSFKNSRAAEQGLKPGFRDRLIMLFIALAIAYSCEYMNGTYNIYHYIALRQVTVCLLAAALFSFSRKELFNKITLLYIFAGGAAGLIYSKVNRSDISDKDYLLNNKVITLNALIALIIGLIAVCMFSRIIKYTAAGKEAAVPHIGVYKALSLLLIALLCVFNNGRYETLIMCAVFLLLSYSFMGFIKNGSWYEIVSGGIRLNFYLSVIYCMLFRSLKAYMLARFGFVFQTATVTGEYLSLMSGLALVMFVIKALKLSPGMKIKDIILSLLNEIVFFGTASVYMLLSMSRLGFLTVAVTAFILLILSAFIYAKQNGAKRLKMFFTYCTGSAIILVLSVIILFFPVYTLQRTLPAMVNRSHIYMMYEEGIVSEYTPQLLGSPDWDSSFYMSPNRFFYVFFERFSRRLNLEIKHIDDANFDKDGIRLYGYNGVPYEEEAAPGNADSYSDDQSDPDNKSSDNDNTEETEADSQDTNPASSDGGSKGAGIANAVNNVSNGRLEIALLYLKNLNMTGHKGMMIEGEDMAHAHNAYLQAAYDFGIPTGIIFALWVLLSIVTGLYRYLKHGNNGDLLVFGISLSFSLVAFTEWNFHYCNPTTIIFLLCIISLLHERETAAAADK